MKKMIFPLLLIFALNASAQKVIKTYYQSIYISGSDFEGVIFSKDYAAYLPGSTGRFTPTLDDIALAEKSVEQNLDTLKNKGGNYPFIYSNLKKYVRQYFGYINENGKKIIYINALMKPLSEDMEKKWLTEEIGVEDGGPAYWQIEINLSTKKIFRFTINGFG